MGFAMKVVLFAAALMVALAPSESAQVRFLDGSTEASPTPLQAADPMPDPMADPMMASDPMDPMPAMPNAVAPHPEPNSPTVERLHEDDVKMESVAAGAAKIAMDAKKVANTAWNHGDQQKQLGESVTTTVM